MPDLIGVFNHATTRGDECVALTLGRVLRDYIQLTGGWSGEVGGRYTEGGHRR